MSDGKEGESKENKKFYLYWAVIIIVITTGVSVIVLGYGFAGYWDDDSTLESELAEKQQQEEDCKTWLEIADILIKKNDGNENITQWSEDDRNVILGVEEQYQKNCIPTDFEILSNLNRCTEIYITIESLIDKMEERHLDTISEEEQEIYNENYEEYFASYCHRIKDEIQNTNEFIEFNKTRGQ